MAVMADSMDRRARNIPDCITPNPVAFLALGLHESGAIGKYVPWRPRMRLSLRSGG
jgi:hypothetical protein